MSRPLDPSHKLLSKYQDQVGGHLGRINEQLDGDISELRRRLKENHAKIASDKDTKATLEREVEKYEQERARNEKSYEELVKKVTEGEEERQRNEFALQQKKDNVIRATGINEQLRGRLHTATSKVHDMHKELATPKERKGAKSGQSTQLEKVIKEGQRLLAINAAQEEYLERLRRDTAAADLALQRVRDDIQKEIKRQREDEKESTLLRERMAIFEEENMKEDDHFDSLVGAFKQKESKQDKNEEQKIKRLKGQTLKIRNMKQKKNEYLDELFEVMKKTREQLEQAKKEETKKLKQQYAALQKEKQHDNQRSSDSDDTSKAEKRASILSQMRSRQANSMNSIVRKRELSRGKPKSSQNTNPTPTPTYLNKQNIALKRNLVASKATQERLEERLRDEEQALNKQTQLVENLTRQLKQVEEERAQIAEPIKDEGAEVDDEREREGRAAIEEHSNAIATQIRELEQNLAEQKKKKEELGRRIKPFEDINIPMYEEQRKGQLIELRRLKNYHHDIKKAIREKQRELELSVIQRESTVDKANATLNIQTGIRAQRRKDMAAIQKEVAQIEKELKGMGLDNITIESATQL